MWLKLFIASATVLACRPAVSFLDVVNEESVKREPRWVSWRARK